MIDKKVEIGIRLKEFALKNFSTLADFSRAMGKHTTYFTTYFKGDSVLGGEQLAKLSELGCDINWLLNGVNNQINTVREKGTEYMTFTDLSKQLEGLKEENKQLKAEIYDLQKERNSLSLKNAELVNEIELLQNELKKLRE